MRNTSRRVIIRGLVKIRLPLLNVDGCGVVAHFERNFAVVQLFQVLACFQNLLGVPLLLMQRIPIKRQLRQLRAVLDTINTFKFIDPVVA